MEQKTLQVEGMSCQHCVKAVESSVGELDGVNAVHVNLEAGKVDVSFDADKV
ncbi:copper ion binding protein, partial [Bacillus spizizenii]|nr:copper ion binding protein [Bacillus spizizenii]